MKTLDLVGLECEEALMLVRMSLRKSKEVGQLQIASTSAPFYILLSKWAEATGHTLTPEISPAQGVPWQLLVAIPNA